ncbi:CLIP domain-containing serine protease HP8-like [Schistocerca nitens]|uniref:CLIP domain-containing serine protease HP8-like n=1 Tax=Schistocerca nitens TaxID=7011 RepID=UPI0021179DCA|nr:CLIP domain-containing serine protease HP8-like [Schistocerca nitens]
MAAPVSASGCCYGTTLPTAGCQLSAGGLTGRGQGGRAGGRSRAAGPVCGSMAAGAPRLLCVCVWLLLAPGSLAQSSRRAQRQECEMTVLADRIYGGDRATIGQYPWLALLQYRSPEGELAFLCGGALVSPRYVLTAAHCLQRKPSGGTLVNVRLGEFDVDSEFDCFEPDVNGTRVCADPPLDVEPERLLPHPGYRGQDNSYQNDIGLIRLNQEVMYTNNIRPICLPSPQDVNETYKNWQPTIAGWGRTETKNWSPVVLQAMVPVVEGGACAAKFGAEASLRVDPRRQVCAGGEQRDSCRGDSGGPLMGTRPADAVTVAVAVASYGPDPCGKPGWPGVYTRVDAYRSWLLRNMRLRSRRSHCHHPPTFTHLLFAEKSLPFVP